MRLLACVLMSVALFSGCDIQQTQTTPFEPFAPANPIAQKSIVVVVTDNCYWCDKQKETIDSMESSGELDGVSIEYTYPTKDYPATAFPTLYVCNGGSCYPPLAGYQTRQHILGMLN